MVQVRDRVAVKPAAAYQLFLDAWVDGLQVVQRSLRWREPGDDGQSWVAASSDEQLMHERVVGVGHGFWRGERVAWRVLVPEVLDLRGIPVASQLVSCSISRDS